MTMKEIIEEQSEIPQDILDILNTILKNEQTCQKSVTSIPAHQRTRADFIKSVRKKRDSVIALISFMQTQDPTSGLKQNEE